jgi:hypothetical protein
MCEALPLCAIHIHGMSLSTGILHFTTLHETVILNNTQVFVGFRRNLMLEYNKKTKILFDSFQPNQSISFRTFQ